MCTIKNMLEDKEKVWLYIDNEELWEQFASMAVAEGFCFGNLPRDRWVYGHAIAVRSDGSMGHVPLFLWCRSFATDVVNCPKRIDFEKFIRGDSDFFCQKMHFH